MTILFITSGLEPGRDGVGDYTRQLAAECIRQNHSCLLISLNDLFVSEPTESIESVDGISIPTLRLPDSMPWEKRVALAVGFRARYSIDWTSLQFVCYGFNRKGIVRNYARYFVPIMAGYPLHVMFHETWIGVGNKASLIHRFIGPIQRHYIHELFHRLKPRLVTTSNAFYASLLQGIGLSAVETPLFSNITVSPVDSDHDIPPALIQARVCDEQGRHPDRFIGLFFGTILASWKSEPFMSILASAQKKIGKKPCIISVGRCGNEGAKLLKELQVRYGHAVEFIILGECTPRQVSALMYLADFGLTTSEWRILGKSSSVATMLGHGLPVIVTGYDFQPIVDTSRPEDPLLHRCDDSLETKLWTGLPRGAIRNSIGASVKNLIDCFARLSTR